jgi:superfamily II DNA or RNA helicase
VTLTEKNKTNVVASVLGSRPAPYEVRVDFRDIDVRVVMANCSCPQFDNGTLCKHLWATLLQIDADGAHQSLQGNTRLDVVEDLEYLDDDEKEDEPFALSSWTARPPTVARSAVRTAQKPKTVPWQQRLAALRDFAAAPDRANQDWRVRPAEREYWFGLDVSACRARKVLSIQFLQRERRRDGQWGKIKRLSISTAELEQASTLDDQQLLQMIAGGANPQSYPASSYYGYGHASCSSGVLAPALYDLVLPRLCATRRFVWTERSNETIDEERRIAWDAGEPWHVRIAMEADAPRKLWRLGARFERGQESAALDAPLFILPSGLIMFPGRLARCAVTDTMAWINLLQHSPTIEIPYRDRSRLLEQLPALPGAGSIAMPDNLQVEQVQLVPQGKLTLQAPTRHHDTRQILGNVTFQYADTGVSPRNNTLGQYDPAREQVLLRDREAEQALLSQVIEAGARPYNLPGYMRGIQTDSPDVQLSERALPEIVDRLILAGWTVEAEGRPIRRPRATKLSVTSGIDWFELHGELEFDGVSATFPELLAAVRKGERYVRLSDGSRGLLPEEWLHRYEDLTKLGTERDDAIVFTRPQAVLLDALLASEAQETVRTDRKFATLREQLRAFGGIQPRAAPAGFRGELREYQKAGLGWLHFLREFGFGGCLADDMGLGKTIQLLALLETRRTRRKENGEQAAPSLVVVPKSLVYNWIDEAARFTPKMRTLDYTGAKREDDRADWPQYDLVVTTYGTLRRDIVHLKDVVFDYAILDEAQAIKNADSQNAKACRLLKAQHRLALTGTPIENHLGELWSLFEFLNPGLLGRARIFKGASVRGFSEASLGTLAKGLKPFMLRRTKAQVLTELPEKTEQTLYCELSPQDRKRYNELRDHYRQQLDATVAKRGLSRSKIQVLEALLRLRQAACHPGLLDARKTKETSAKLETLLCQIAEVIEEGHKVLVFSQFTSLLAIVRHHLDAQGRTYEYLDGRTRDRAARVRRFQDDPFCRLFLISLKAGGLGLNLTAADYVFILDPWWNPAVEAQAVDRAHRLGQTRRVFAYRLIARDTVEEKIIALQQGKRALAEAIVTADESLISKLTLEDLQLLLS